MAQSLMTLREVRNLYFPAIPIHRLKYAVAEHGIEPRQRAGTTRLFADDQLGEIRQAMDLVATHRGAGGVRS
jgi:hypothetical protein